MDLKLLAALAPALASLLLCVFIEGRIISRVRVFMRRLRRDEPLLELLAEVTVHLSTYGSAVVGTLAHFLLHEETGVLFPLLVGVPWFIVFLRLSLWLRRLLRKLRD
jgi:hypothetical protein